MKNTTAEIMRNKKINKKTCNNQEKAKKEHVTWSNISLKGSSSGHKFIKIENNHQQSEPTNKNNSNTARNPYLSKDMFNQSKSKSEQWLLNKNDNRKAEELHSISQLKLDCLASWNAGNSPFYSSYESGLKPHFQTPSNEVLNTEYTNHETELRYDSETWEVSFSNEKTKKAPRTSKISIPASMLKYQ